MYWIEYLAVSRQRHQRLAENACRGTSCCMSQCICWTLILLLKHTFFDVWKTSRMHILSECPRSPIFPKPTHSHKHAHINALSYAGLGGWIISRGATFDGAGWNSSCTHSLGPPGNIRSHWWGLERRHIYADHVQITTLSLVTDTQTCDQTLLWTSHKLDLMPHQLATGRI